MNGYRKAKAMLKFASGLVLALCLAGGAFAQTRGPFVKDEIRGTPPNTYRYTEGPPPTAAELAQYARPGPKTRYVGVFGEGMSTIAIWGVDEHRFVAWDPKARNWGDVDVAIEGWVAGIKNVAGWNPNSPKVCAPVAPVPKVAPSPNERIAER